MTRPTPAIDSSANPNGAPRADVRGAARAARRGTLAALLASALAGASALLGFAAPAAAQDNVLNLYSARHYQTDEAMYNNFTKATGIRIQRIEAGDEALLERIRSEGRSSPADVILLADAARLWKAQADGLFQPFKSAVLDRRIPAALHGKDDGQGPDWYAFSLRARVIVYDRTKIRPEQVARYEDLAAPALKGQICVRSATHPYMLSLIGALSEHSGEQKTEEWARGVVANLARTPRGGDTDQIKAVAAGECGLALTNTYYFVRMLRSSNATEREMAQRLGFVWPNQGTTGTHVNVSGGGIARNAPHRDAAARFLEYLASEEAQTYFAVGNNEWPVVAGVPLKNPELESLGKFKADPLTIERIGRSQMTAQKIIDRAGWR